MNIVKKVAFTLLVIGGLNWGLVGLFDYDLVAEFLPRTIAVLVYILVGVSAIISIFAMKGCGSCKKEDSTEESVEESINPSHSISQSENLNQDDSMNNSQM